MAGGTGIAQIELKFTSWTVSGAFVDTDPFEIGGIVGRGCSVGLTLGAGG